jgi:hypothetical protein
MKFADLLQFQKPPQTLEELHAKVTAIAALTPRSRTEFLEACENEAKNLIAGLSQSSDDDIHYIYSVCNGELTELEKQVCQSILNLQNDFQNELQNKKSDGKQRQANNKNGALSDFVDATATPDMLAPLQSINQYNSIANAIKQSRHQPTSMPFRFRILSRANEIYGANDWTTNLTNTAENFYDLLTGAADDAYHSDFEPVQECFLQGAAGNFVCNKMLTELHGYSNANGTAPMAAVGAFSLENSTSENQSRSISFGLSSYNFASVFLKVEEWTPLFQTTSNLHHSSVMTADFVIPANQTATILLSSTPYYYWYSGRGSSSTVAQTHLGQFLQWNIRLLS